MLEPRYEDGRRVGLVSTVERMTGQHLKFGCPQCGQAGEVFWHADGSQLLFVRVTNGFHIEDERVTGSNSILVCDECDEIDPARLALDSGSRDVLTTAKKGPQ